LTQIVKQFEKENSFQFNDNDWEVIKSFEEQLNPITQENIVLIEDLLGKSTFFFFFLQN